MRATAGMTRWSALAAVDLAERLNSAGLPKTCFLRVTPVDPHARPRRSVSPDSVRVSLTINVTMQGERLTVPGLSWIVEKCFGEDNLRLISRHHNPRQPADLAQAARLIAAESRQLAKEWDEVAS